MNSRFPLTVLQPVLSTFQLATGLFPISFLLRDEEPGKENFPEKGYFDFLPAKGGVSMEVARTVEKNDVVARGKDIADDIAELFALLMPLYEAAVE